ncbi:hypothetical protein PI93_022815 [Pandoraea fibrosis]|uniref:Flagellar hook-length control protein-like C-terminal domain-containing protein n=1 Tax=Pandoraea fibrosis TaxID=1891094 RepID=A0ABX6HW61_9BURK|nr:flagellar hook-length control protein FliK [Pandoraea fibrosis]QHE91277.1 hypothetical protein PJ20_005185 [Pandoraea fibrosis]QHF15166.1 hypothetical protein PI93_022815 [Pandoraea fibrosis]
MIVEITRLMTPGSADSLAPVADGALPDGFAQTLADAGIDTALGDFAASLDRSTGQVPDFSGQDTEREAGLVAPAQAPETQALAHPDVATFTGLPAIAVKPAVAPGDDGLLAADDAASLPHDVPVLPGVVMPVADDLAFATQDRPAAGDESLRDTVAPHIATLLAAHEHRMRGALGSQVSAPDGQPQAGDVDTSVSSPAAAVRASAAVASASLVLPPLGPVTPSLATRQMATEPASQGVASIDNGATPALRTPFAPVTFGNAYAGEPSAPTVSSGSVSANVAAGDDTAVARALSERVHTMTQKGVHEARLRLTPAELGDIAIVVRKSPMQLSVSLQVARPEALSLVQGTAALLRDMLSQRHPGEVQVSVAGMPSYSGDGASGNARERQSRDDSSGEADPGLALGDAARERKAFRL